MKGQGGAPPDISGGSVDFAAGLERQRFTELSPVCELSGCDNRALHHAYIKVPTLRAPEPIMVCQNCAEKHHGSGGLHVVGGDRIQLFSGLAEIAPEYRPILGYCLSRRTTRQLFSFFGDDVQATGVTVTTLRKRGWLTNSNGYWRTDVGALPRKE
jgi:hypothetical protein